MASLALCKRPYKDCLSHSSACPAKQRCIEQLRNCFKFNDFRPGQLDAILPVMHGNDVFVRMGTGSGKSLCMFIPVLAMHENAVAAVFSPLIGLMEQKVL